MRLIPRIPKDFFTDSSKTIASLRAYNKKSQHIRVPQTMFNPLRVKDECQRQHIKGLRKNFFVWRGMLFRNGFFYQEFTANKLMTENVCPSLKEVKQFQVDEKQRIHQEFYDSDQDEWDLLDDQTLLKTIRDDPQLQVTVGERVKVIEGQFKDLQGVITQISDGLVSFQADEKKQFPVTVRGFQVRKCFKVGESVRIIQGNRAGESGIVTQILQDAEGLDSHAVISMSSDKSHCNLTVLISNLRIKTETDCIN